MISIKTFIIVLIFTTSLLASPLHKAVASINEKKIHILVEEGSEINAVDDKGRTPLHLASHIGRYTIVKYLVENGADVHMKDHMHKTPLVYAIEKNRIKVIIYLSKEANKEKIDTYKNVFVLAAEGKVDEAKELFETVDINSINEDGKTILHIGCEYIQEEVVKLALALGVNKDLADHDGRTALNYAKLSGNKNIIKLIQDHNASK